MIRKSILALTTLSMLLAASLVGAQAPATQSSGTTKAPAKAPAKAGSALSSVKTPPAAAVTNARGAATGAKAAAPGAAAMVDLNSAGKADLMKLPGIGEAISAKIIAGRPWSNKAQLLSKGVVNKPTYDKIQSLVIAKQK